LIENNDGLDSYIDIAEIVQDLLSVKFYILIATTLIGIGSVFYALSLSDEYKSRMILKPVEDNSQSYVNQFGAIASFAGLGMPIAQEIDKSSFALQILETRDFFEKLIADELFLTELIAVDGFDKNSFKPTYDLNLYNFKDNKLLPDYKSKISIEKMHRKFLQSIEITTTDRGFTEIIIIHYSPVIAKRWLELIFNKMNESIKEIKTLEAEKSIAYLNKELALARESELKKVIAELIESQIQTMMISNISDDFVFSLVDSPRIAEKKFAPHRAKICILATILGFILLCMIRIFYKYTYRHQRELA
jgi:uncharacterized protein involved in exopolysaccharide biosynthesis